MPVSKQMSRVDGTAIYRQLRNDVISAGILDRSYSYYTNLAIFSFIGFFFCLYQLYFVASGIGYLIWGVLFAIFVIQLGGFFHDAGHEAIFRSKKNNNILGHISAGLLALPFNNWKNNHNKHHAMTNIIDEDPDLKRPLLFLTEEQYAKQKGIIRFLAQYQAFFYYPIGSLTLLFFQLSNIVYYHKIFTKKLVWEIALFALGLFVWLVLPFFFFPIMKVVLIDCIVYLTAGFYMYNIFAPNHKGMPQLNSKKKLSFLEHQIMTTRNVYPNPITDFIYMGLNYQIEHHLFPNCPRNKLKLITPYVEDACQKMNLEFTRVSILESNKIILTELRAIVKTSLD